MEEKKLNEWMDLFNTQTDVVKNELTDLLVMVSDGRIPDVGILKAFNTDMDTLVFQYGQVKETAQAMLDVDEMPEEGSKVAAYVDAINNSRRRLIKLQFEKAEAILKRFLKVKSFITDYEAALLPFKAKVSTVLREISMENIDDMISETKAPELFLKALDIENIHEPEGVSLLKEINKYYPMQVQWGLAGRQYYVDENVDTNTQAKSVTEQQSKDNHVAKKGIIDESIVYSGIAVQEQEQKEEEGERGLTN